jgi:hypothetical protein
LERQVYAHLGARGNRQRFVVKQTVSLRLSRVPSSW